MTRIRSPESRARRAWAIAGRAALALVMSALVLTLAACGGSAGGGDEGADADPAHVHGLGVTPADSALLGFTVLGPDHFLGSGHPDLRDELPPLPGLIESRDGGRSGEPVSLLGEADFHALRTTGSLVYGHDASGGRLMLSRDGGGTWASRRPPGPVADVVADPADPGHLLVSGEAGPVASGDGGRSWDPLDAPHGLLAWPSRDALYAVSFDGRVLISRDRGASWSSVGAVAGPPAALTVTDARTLIVALHDGGFANSSDGGRTWAQGAWPT